MGQLSILGFYENLALLGPLLLLVLMPVGFIASAWVTNNVMGYFKPDVYETSLFDRICTFALLLALFAFYVYFITNLFVE